MEASRAEPAPHRLRAILDFDSGLHSDRSQSRRVGPGRRRTPTVLGKPAARIAELQRDHRPAVAVRSTDSFRCCRQLFSSCIARTGVNCMIRKFAVHIMAIVGLFSLLASAQSNQQLRFCLHSDPKTFNPLLAEEDSSETIRYLTGGV